MMTTFIAAAGLLVIATLAVMLWPVLRPRVRPAAPDARAASLAVYRDQKRAIDDDYAAGTSTAEEHDEAVDELSHRVAEELAAPGNASAPSSTPAKPRFSRWPLAAVLGVVVPLAATVLYLRLGNPDVLREAPAIAAGREPTEHEIVAMVDRLAARMKENPDDPKGWSLLGRSYAALGRFRDAADAYSHAEALAPNDADILADHADALAMAQGEKIAGEPLALVERALVIDPKHPKALALAGTAAMDAGDSQRALGYWRRLASQVPAGSPDAERIAAIIAEIEQPPAPSASAPASTGGNRSIQDDIAAKEIRGRVELSAALRSRVAPDDSVFVFARAAHGGRMPLAARRFTARALPLEFTLDDSASMAGAKLSSASSVVVEARVSKSGNPIAQPGDLFARSGPVKPGANGVALTIDQVVQ